MLREQLTTRSKKADSIARHAGQRWRSGSTKTALNHSSCWQRTRAVPAAWEKIDHGRVREAEEICRRLMIQFSRKRNGSTMPQVPVGSASESMQSLRPDRSGLLTTAPTFRHDSPTQAAEVPSRGAALARAERCEPAGRYARAARPCHDLGKLDCRRNFMVQVDGAGSCLVLRQPRVTIGPISSVTSIPDVGLIAEPARRSRRSNGSMKIISCAVRC